MARTMNSIFWHDYETSGVSPALDRPLQFAGIRTDENLEIIEAPVSFYCKPSRDILPHPEACLVTGITPQKADAEGLSEPEFMARVHRELAKPGTCGAGYNSIRFDDEVTRYSFYRNFYDPYEREWQGGNSRWDIIDMLRLTHALRPEGIVWPKNEEGFTSFRLELLTEANGISHEAAHDALSDVYATIAMAKLIKQRQPKLYDYLYQNRQKNRVKQLLDLSARRPFLHVSSKLPRENGYTAIMMPICQHPKNANAIIAFNLSQSPESLIELSADEIREVIFTPSADLTEGQERVALKGIHLNRCPVVATPRLLDTPAAERLKIDVARCEKHWQALQSQDLSAKVEAVFSSSPEFGPSDAEAALYESFIPNRDKPLLGRVRAAEAEELSILQSQFEDKRYRELLFRYRARNYPDSLNDEEMMVWEEQRFQRLSEPSTGRLCLEDYFDRIDELYADASPESKKVLDSLRDWGDLLISQ